MNLTSHYCEQIFLFGICYFSFFFYLTVSLAKSLALIWKASTTIFVTTLTALCHFSMLHQPTLLEAFGNYHIFSNRFQPSLHESRWNVIRVLFFPNHIFTTVIVGRFSEFCSIASYESSLWKGQNCRQRMKFRLKHRRPTRSSKTIIWRTFGGARLFPISDSQLPDKSIAQMGSSNWDCSSHSVITW